MWPLLWKSQPIDGIFSELRRGLEKSINRCGKTCDGYANQSEEELYQTLENSWVKKKNWCPCFSSALFCFSVLNHAFLVSPSCSIVAEIRSGNWISIPFNKHNNMTHPKKTIVNTSLQNLIVLKNTDKPRWRYFALLPLAQIHLNSKFVVLLEHVRDSANESWRVSGLKLDWGK